MQQLHEGEIAPDFKHDDVSGKPIALSNYKHGYIFLVFLRYAECPWCNLAVHRLEIESKLLKENGCEVICFIQSSKERIIENIHNRHALKPTFPIIADASQQTYKRYGVGRSYVAAMRSITKIPSWVHAVRDHGFKQKSIKGDLFLAPASFLIDAKDKTILKAMYDKSFFEHETFSPLYDALFERNL